MALCQIDPVDERLYGTDTQSSACINIRRGRMLLSADQYMSTIDIFDPDISHYMFSTPVSFRNQSSVRVFIEK